MSILVGFLIGVDGAMAPISGLLRCKMALWLVRAGSKGEQETAVLDGNVVAIGWIDMPDLSKVQTLDEMKELYSTIYKQSKKNSVSNVARQIWKFAKEIKVGDWVALPLKSSSKIAIGKVEGTYQYDAKSELLRHSVPVKWINTEIPRTAFAQDILHSLGAFLTVCRIERNDAEKRIKQIVSGNYEKIPDSSSSENDQEDTEVDVEQNSRDQVLKFIGDNFKKHELTHLISAILKTHGYKTFVSPEGPDGGIDILAGKGPLGLDRPHLAVQVKSSTSTSDGEAVRSFVGAASDHKADSMLFVSWGDFTRVVYKESKTRYFNLRLWNSDDILNAVFECYDRLDPDTQAKLPLKRIWAVVLDEE